MGTFPSEPRENRHRLNLLVLLGKVDDGGDGIDLVEILALLLLLIVEDGLLDDGADELLVEDGLGHFSHIDGCTAKEELLQQSLNPMVILLLRAPSLEFNLQRQQQSKYFANILQKIPDLKFLPLLFLLVVTATVIRSLWYNASLFRSIGHLESNIER